MLVTFSTKAFADITMFGDVAVHLLKLMGHSGTVPGALLAADVPEALRKLESGLESESPQPPTNEGDEEEPVSLHVRAVPLLDLLAAAAKDECDVMWDRS